jgi:hypothetical protein
MQHEKALQMAVAAGAKAGDKSCDFSGHWENQYDPPSSMALVVDGSSVTGRYKSRSSVGGGELCGELKGYVAGDLISFLVLWPRGSMTAWVGQMVDDDTAPRIKTLWHLVMEIPDEKEPTILWQSILTGADEFHR